MILPIDPTNKLSFKRFIKDGDLIIVYERHDTMKAVKVSEDGHSEWIGKPFGSKVLSNKGAFVYLLAPTPEILYIANSSFVVMYLEIVPSCVVLESGTGSGSLTTSLARVVAPTSHVYTFDFHEQRAGSARVEALGTRCLEVQSVWASTPSRGCDGVGRVVRSPSSVVRGPDLGAFVGIGVGWASGHAASRLSGRGWGGPHGTAPRGREVGVEGTRGTAWASGHSASRSKPGRGASGHSASRSKPSRGASEYGHLRCGR
ncbi:hypothetical protein R3W88_016895 [Solanum pinnatisectum]|uniref:tRNA (adenine(58)-N(1))-methyltransferase n=1 Tax=Solanum pinnatisectum TaxID=50273 RepID=A0AAV9L2V5_9SOLN|nr:hypothetical protein R3W88_016895 [Solanum pinnatisectum]